MIDPIDGYGIGMMAIDFIMGMFTTLGVVWLIEKKY